MQHGTVPPQRRSVEAPTQIPPRGWWRVLKGGVRASQDDNAAVMAGGVAFFGFLAIFPALIALLTVYGLVANPAQVTRQVTAMGGLPPSARALLVEQVTSVSAASGSALTIGLIISLLVALWSASSGVSNLMSALTLAYGERETRGFLTFRATALGLTAILIAFTLVILALTVVLAPLLNALGVGVLGRALAEVVRWGLLVAVMIVGLAVVYRLAPDRRAPRWRWVSPGALAGTVLWIAGTVVFNLYIAYFGDYNKTYGALAGVIVLMLWLYLASYIVLLGAEINVAAEREVTVGSHRATDPAWPGEAADRGAETTQRTS